MKIKISDSSNINGQAIITTCDILSAVAKRREREIIEAIKNNISWQEYRGLIDDFHRLFMKRQVLVHNVICDNGKKVFSRILANDFTYSGVANYCALGTGTSAGVHTDTQLGTEVYRNLISAKTFVLLKTYLSTFFAAGDCNGTYKEVGHFIDATATVNSGQMWSHIGDPDTAELPVTKTDSDSLTIDYSSTWS